MWKCTSRDRRKPRSSPLRAAPGLSSLDRALIVYGKHGNPPAPEGRGGVLFSSNCWKKHAVKSLQHNDVYVVNAVSEDEAEPDTNKILWRKQT